MENRHTVDQYKQIYKYAKDHLEDKAFAEEYSHQLTIYKAAVDEIFKDSKVLPGTLEILKDIDMLAAQHKYIHEKLQNACLEKDRLYQYKKNYDNYLGKEVER